MNFKSFDLNLLRVLDALLREKSTVKAGLRIGLSQPAVSAALGRLRVALGDPLFVRAGQGLAPTDVALSLEVPLRQALDGLEALLGAHQDFDPMHATDIFKISGTDFFAEMLMPRLADRLSQVAPNMRVQLVDLVPDNYVETLEGRAVDLALIPAMAFPDWLDHQAIFHSSFVAVVRQGNPRIARAGLAPGQVMPIDLFCDMGHVLFSPEGKLQTMGDAALAKVGRKRRVVMTMPVFSGVWRAVSESDLIAVLPAQLARRIAPKANLDIYELPMTIHPVVLTMVWHKRFSGSAAHTWLRGQIAELLRPLNEDYDALPPDEPSSVHVQAR